MLYYMPIYYIELEITAYFLSFIYFDVQNAEENQASLQMALMEASQKAAKMGDSDDLRKQLDQLRQKTIATEADLKESNSKLNNQVSELTTQLLNANKKAEDLNAELETCKVSYAN